MPPISCECSEIGISLKVVNEMLPCFVRFFSPPWIWIKFDTGDAHKIRMSVSFVEVCAVKSVLSLEACVNFYPDSDLPWFYGPADACWKFLYVGRPIHEASRTCIYTTYAFEMGRVA